MRLAISNIAWEPEEDELVARLINRMGLDAIDVAPGKYFPEPSNAKDTDLARVRAWWSERGIEITGMQALLFGTNGLNLFGPRGVQDSMLQHLTHICRIGAALGATRLVFGSPRNRDRSGLADELAMDTAVRFFRRLGDIAQSFGTLMCLEPNPKCYGGNFMTTSKETLTVVQRVDHPAIRMQFDTGALTINGEDPGTVLDGCSQFVGHVHASEPDLVPLGDAGSDHTRMRAALEQHLPTHVVSIEMLATVREPHEVSIERALTVAIRHYSSRGSGAIG